MAEFFNNLNIQDLWVSLMGFLSLNGATIIGLIIAWAKGKINQNTSIDKMKEESKKEQENVAKACLDTLDKVEARIQELELCINDALNAAQEAEKKELEAQSIKLSKTIDEVKAKTICLTDELNKL